MTLKLTRSKKLVIHVLIGLAVVASGGVLWLSSETNVIQETGTVGGGTYGPLSQGHNANIPYGDTSLVIQCKSVYAVQVWLLTSQNYASWSKGSANANPLIQDLGTDVTISTIIKNSGSYVVVVGKAAGYISSTYNIKISATAYPHRIAALVLMIAGLAIVALGLFSRFYVLDLGSRRTEQYREKASDSR